MTEVKNKKMLAGIERKPNELERREMVQVGEKNVWSEFLGKLAETEQIFAKQHKPFDSQCAKFDFKQQLRMGKEEQLEVLGYSIDPKFKDIIFDYEQYGNADRFEKIIEDEEIEIQNINGVRSPMKVGVTIKYKCRRGHGVSVFVPAVEQPVAQVTQTEVLKELIQVVKELKEVK